ncbi:uncharacterized protein LOC141696459 [Apium graveolens]|uniref:uncharacterized protein LOC141696459 n=1 Tax=Apium graveolens TaxID=4045 RepID=UPI003D78D1C7
MIIANLNKIRVNQDSFCGDSSRSGSDVGISVVTNVFESVDQGYQFYNTYAHLGGFSIRKITEKLDDAGHHFLLSSREMTTSLRNICYNGAKVNIGVSKSFSFAKEMYGRYANDKSKSLYYSYDVESDGRPTALFWADSIGRRNFELYGDAISFDAIFDTNRYNLIFAPFTGVDKHDICVTFASCLLSHESVADYSWAFGHLVKAMGRNHVLIITDQCPAMKVSVRDIFSNVNGLVLSKHRLCMCLEEILASCLEMQIKRMSEEVDSVTHFEIRDVRVKDKLFKVSVSMNHEVCSCKKFVMCGIVCRHAFCGLKQIRVTKFSRSPILNCWMQTADSGTSLNFDMVTSDYFKMEQVSLKLTTIWFDFCQAVDKAVVEMDRLEHVHSTIKKLNTVFDAYDGSIVSFKKKDHIAAMVGQQPEGEVNILPPNVCKNKGNYFKMMMNDREKAINKSNKRSRKCALCRATTHDARRCIKRKKASVE